MTGRAHAKLPQIVLIAAASAALLAMAWAMAARVGVPYALEWQEPAMMEHALRLRAGEPLYIKPSVDFAPFPYPPLFYAFGSALMGVLGESLSALRAVSVLGVLLVFSSLLGSFRWLGGLAACGWFAATYGWTGFWLDVARVDSLGLGLGAVGLALVLRAEAANERALPAAFTGGVASALAVLAKQTQLGLAVALAVALLLRARHRRAGIAYLIALASVLVPTVAYLELSSDGAFLWTTVDLLRGSPFHAPAILGFWIESAWVLALPLALTVLAYATRARVTWSPGLVIGALALLGTAWLGRAHEGGFDNTLLPAALASAFVSGAALRGLLAAEDRRAPWLGAACATALMCVVFQDPRPAMPTDAHQEAYAVAAAKVAQLQATGEVWQPISALPSHSRGFAHKMAIVDVAKSLQIEEAQGLLVELTTALAAQRFAAIILDGPPRQLWGDLGSVIDASYRITGTLGAAELPNGEDLLKPITGAGVAPRVILTPR